jgi:hypothetical protein
MASGWQGLADQMNTMFQSGSNIADTGTQFRKRHGHNGQGTDPGTIPYKFGLFAVAAHDQKQKNVINPNDEVKWLIDTGTRHFDPSSIAAIENAVITSLTQPSGKEIPINFIIDATNPPAPGKQATANVAATLGSAGISSYTITIYCVP